jgi:hypothetical protein
MLNLTNRDSPADGRVKMESPINVTIPAKGSELKAMTSGKTNDANSTPPGTLLKTYIP